MANLSSQSLLVVGGGIVGLCIAVAAQARGLSVTLVARDDAADTASGIAAGMIAPALEALGEPEPDVTYNRLKVAQTAWAELLSLWPDSLQTSIISAQAETRNLYVWPQSDNSSDITTPRLHAMGVTFAALSDDELEPIAADCDGVRVDGDWLIEARATLTALQAQFDAAGGDRIKGVVSSLTKTSVTLDSGDQLGADYVVVAAGFGGLALADAVPSLAHLTPVKGHLLDLGFGSLAGEGRGTVIRSPAGYLADYGSNAKYGATMQFGQSDLEIEATVVAQLKNRAHRMMPDLSLDSARPRVGVRASTPDGWPLIGRDRSGVYVATGMRRNGYVFAPYAAQLILADIAGEEAPQDAGLYEPNRF